MKDGGKAEKLLIQVVGLQEKVIGADHPDKLTRVMDLVAIHRNQGRWKDAEKLEVQVVKRQKEVWRR